MRKVDHLDRFAKRHKITTALIVVAIIALCADRAYRLDRAESGVLYCQARGST